MSTSSPPSDSKMLVILKVPSTTLSRFGSASSKDSTPAPAVSTPTTKKKRGGGGGGGRGTGSRGSQIPPSSPILGPEDGTATPTKAQHREKPGPKSAAYIVNAAIKALDRTGTPTRRWVKQPVDIKSFTGFKYSLVGWAGLRMPGDKEDDEEDNDNDKNNRKSQESHEAKAKSGSKEQTEGKEDNEKRDPEEKIDESETKNSEVKDSEPRSTEEPEPSINATPQVKAE